MKFDTARSQEESEACKRCRDLHLLELLDSTPPWTNQDQLAQAFGAGHELMRSLGRIANLELWEDCSVCRLLYAISPTASSSEQEMFVVHDWTICRIAGETGLEFDDALKREYATCLVVVLRPSALDSIPFPIRAHRGDAVCLLEDDLRPGRTLGGREMNSDEIDISLIQKWISNCARQHGSACKPLYTPSLHMISLVDVESRVIVHHPGHSFDYIALSYVWGNVKQPSYKVGERIGPLPATLEDALTFTKMMGKQYLWADSLCIDQGNHAEKEDQIQRMRDIYHGAYLTVIAISGDSADAGLPKLSSESRYQQVTCSIKGRRLVGLMPTLSQQVWVSPWGQRAWTFQESRLSPRCLLMSDHQLYFECKGFQCIESLCIEQSWVHGLSQEANTTSKSFASWMMSQGGSGCFRHAVDMPEHRLNNYGCGLNLYSARKMSYPGDCVSAFTGMLQTFGEVYPKGFIQGLPIEDLNWGLLWALRDPSPRRPDFPSWSWAGWNGAVWYGQPVEHTRPSRCPVNLEIGHLVQGEYRLLFHNSVERRGNGTTVSLAIRDDPVDRAHTRGQNKLPELPVLNQIHQDQALIISATCFRFKLDFGQPGHSRAETGLPGIFAFQIRHVACLIRIISTDTEVTGLQKEEKACILLARDFFDKYIVHYLLLIYPIAGTATCTRGTTLMLFVPLDSLEILEDLKPAWERIVLL